jgi:hypothetical protein
MAYEWQPLMTAWSEQMLAASDVQIDPAVRASGRLGEEGATEAEIVELERRLNVALPPSYREFLAFSNGWHNPGVFVDRLWSTRDVDWFTVRNREWAEIYNEGGSDPMSDEEYLVYGPEQDCARFRQEYLLTALEISEVGDSAVMLLNPKTVDGSGEWEAWFFANWNPGADRYPSFWDLMQSQYDTFRRLR